MATDAWFNGASLGHTARPVSWTCMTGELHLEPTVVRFHVLTPCFDRFAFMCAQGACRRTYSSHTWVCIMLTVLSGFLPPLVLVASASMPLAVIFILLIIGGVEVCSAASTMLLCIV